MHINMFNIIPRGVYISKMSPAHLKILTNYSFFLPAYHWRHEHTAKYDPKNFATAGTIKDVKMQLEELMGAEKGYKPLDAPHANLAEYLPASQRELKPRTMNDSFASAIVPLSTDLELQEKYITFLGHVRLGRLLEDMDLFAVYVCHKHIHNPKLPKGKPTPYVFVTALVDKIEFSDFIPKLKEDIRISGHVSWVGKSSMEVVVWLEQKSGDKLESVTRALFVMAARDPTTLNPAIVNPLIGTNKREKLILGGGESRKKHRILIRSQHLTKVIPNAEEQTIMHGLFLRTVDINDISLKKRKLPEGCVWMEHCTLSNIIFSHPEHRNLHNKVFGGFLLRHALELSWALGFFFSKYRPTLKAMSDISFSRALEVNSLIKMHGHVVFTHKQYFQITVHAETWDSDSGKNATTNIFHFTYHAPELVREVFPLTYQEVMMYIDGRRHFFNVMLIQTKEPKQSAKK